MNEYSLAKVELVIFESTSLKHLQEKINSPFMVEPLMALEYMKIVLFISN